jgi:hypothetical protein
MPFSMACFAWNLLISFLASHKVGNELLRRVLLQNTERDVDDSY